MGVDWLPEPGDTLDERFELVEQIGVGPTGSVFVGRRLADDQRVVVKVFHPELFAGQVRGPNTLRLQRARMMQGDRLVSLDEIEIREDLAFVVMQPIEQAPLDAWRASHSPVSQKDALPIVRAVGEALESVHQLGVHGDIKPSNVFVGETGDVIVGDPWFLEGLAGIRDVEGLAPRADSWLAPEQRAGTWQERPETDIYRLALLMGWLLSGEPVNGGVSLRDQGVSCSDSFDEAFLRATQESPGERFGQVRELLSALLDDHIPEAELDLQADPLADTGITDSNPAFETGETITGGVQLLDEEAAIELDDEAPETRPEEDGETGQEGDEGDATAPGSPFDPDEAGAAPTPDDADDEDDDTIVGGPTASELEELAQRSVVLETGEVIEVTPADMPALGSVAHEEVAVEAVIEGDGAAPSDDAPEPLGDDLLTESHSPDGSLEDAPTTRPTERSEPAPETVQSAGRDAVEEAKRTTRRQVRPERRPSIRTNPIILVGPLLLVASLVVAVTVLDTVLERRMLATAVTTTADPKDSRSPVTPQETPPVTPPVAPAPSVDPPTGDVSPTTDTAVADQEQAQSSDAADTTADDVGPTADVAPAAALASTVSETTDPKAVTCRDSMIKIRRAKKSTPPVDPPVYAVWCIERYEFPGKGRTPRTNVSQEKAAALCAKRDARLCTRSEWRIACGGKYPYKGEFDPSTCNSAAPGPTARPIKPAGSKLRCRSGWGAYDMVGNVSEWTADGHVIGGSARGDAERGTCYRSVPRKAGGSDVGFRCCADPTPTETKK